MPVGTSVVHEMGILACDRAETHNHCSVAYPRWLRGKESPAMREMPLPSLGREDPWRRKWQPTPVFLPGKCHGQRSLAGYNPWGCKELDTTEWLNNNKPALSFFLYKSVFYLDKSPLSTHCFCSRNTCLCMLSHI